MDERDKLLEERLLRAAEQFNTGFWYECHETLEEIWVSAVGELRDFCQGFLQFSVAIYKWKNGSFDSAIRLLERGDTYLSRVSPVFYGFDVHGLRIAGGRMRDELVSLGEKRMGEMDIHLIPRIKVMTLGKHTLKPV